MKVSQFQGDIEEIHQGAAAFITRQHYNQKCLGFIISHLKINELKIKVKSAKTINGCNELTFFTYLKGFT